MYVITDFAFSRNQKAIGQRDSDLGHGVCSQRCVVAAQAIGSESASEAVCELDRESTWLRRADGAAHATNAMKRHVDIRDVYTLFQEGIPKKRPTKGGDNTS